MKYCNGFGTASIGPGNFGIVTGSRPARPSGIVAWTSRVYHCAMDNTELITRLTAIVGSGGVVDPALPEAEPFVEEARGDYRGRPTAIVLPRTTAEVAEVVRLGVELGAAIVPQGGNTGLCGGAVAEPGELVLSLRRLNRVRSFDALEGTATVEAGCILADVQRLAADGGWLFPVSLGAEGSCMIGGNISTNAGGINVLRYGNTRAQVLGLEVVLSDGRIWDGLSPLVKNNTGYDLKQLFIGAEGTLGIVTAATLRLYPAPAASQTLLLGFDRLPDCLELLATARRLSGDQLSSFELIPEIAMCCAARHVPGVANPLAAATPWYILCQFATPSPAISVESIASMFLEQVYERGLVADAVVAESTARERELWRIREAIVAAQRCEGGAVSHDVSVPVSKVPTLIERVLPAVERALPGIRPYPFGHIGDGNVHCNMLKPVDMDPAEFNAAKPRVREAVYGVVAELGGSFSAEHGVGRLKLELMERCKSPTELELMRALRRAIEPSGLLNPGKVV